MIKGLLCVAVFSVFASAILGHTNDLKPSVDVKPNHSKERLSVDVKIIEDDENGPRKTKVKVHLNVTIEEDEVKLNGKVTELDVLVKYNINAEIEYSPGEIHVKPVTVHILVARKDLPHGHQYFIEEQVILVEDKEVEQFKIQLLTIHMNIDGKEIKRTYEIISFKDSRIMKTHPSRFCGQDDPAPRKMPEDEPKLPDERGLGSQFPGHGRHHHRHPHGRPHGYPHGHHPHKKHGNGKGFCSRFHKLPLVARVLIVVAVVLLVLTSVIFFAMCCCRKAKKSYAVEKGDDFKAEFDIEEEEAEPLPEKLAFDDKQVLIA